MKTEILERQISTVTEYLEKTATDTEVITYWNSLCASECDEVNMIRFMDDLGEYFNEMSVSGFMRLIRPNSRFDLTDELWSYDGQGFIRSFKLFDVHEYIDIRYLAEDIVSWSENYQLQNTLRDILNSFEKGAE